MDAANKQIELQRDLIKLHYRECFGNPSRQAEFVTKNGKRIEIWKWSEEVSGEGVALYATIGASIELNGLPARCEFFIGLTPEVDDIAESLSEISLKGNGTKNVPNFGDTLTLPWGLWKGTDMSTFLITAGGEEIIRPLKKNGYCIDFIKLVPLFPNEYRYKKEVGEDELWLRFEENEVPYWDSQRKSLFSI